MNRILLTVLIALGGFSAHGQYIADYGVTNWGASGVGFNTGYAKRLSSRVDVLGDLRAIGSNSIFGSSIVDSSGGMGGWTCGCPVMLTLSDSSIQTDCYKCVGSLSATSGCSLCYRPTSQTNDGCAQCYNRPRRDFLTLCHNEWASDSPIVAQSIFPFGNQFLVPDSTNDLILYENGGDVLADSLGAYLKNVQGPITLPYNPYRPTSTGVLSARIFRFHDYDNISSPWQGNRTVIAALKGQPAQWWPGFVDGEGDSIFVQETRIPISIKNFHPNVYCDYPDSLDSFLKARILSGLRDSLQLLPYKTGYDLGHPFGNSSAYALDAASGALRFTATDSGMYYLAYKVTEYRDGLPLGEITTTRLAYVLDSAATLPTALPLQNISLTGTASYDSANRKFYACPGDLISFDMRIASPLADADIVVQSNLGAFPPDNVWGAGPLTIYTQYTDTVLLHFSYTVQPGMEKRLYYPYADWADIACGPGHMALHQSTGVTLSVGACGTGVEVPDKKREKVRVFPNPATDAISIAVSSDLLEAGGEVSATLMDMTGKVVLELYRGSAEGLSGKRLELPASLTRGIYVVQTRTQSGTVHQTKLILQ